MSGIQVHTIFSDDVRFEVGNKQSIVGIYSGSMFLPEFPAVIPKLCVSFWIYIPKDVSANSANYLLLKDDEVIANVPINIGGIDFTSADLSNGKATANVVQSLIALSPLYVDKQTVLKTRLIVDGEELKSSSLQIFENPA